MAGNEYSEVIEVSNIDKEPPVVESEDDLIDVLSNTIKLDLSNINTPSGVYKIILPNGEEIVNPTENVITFKVSRNGMYRFVVVDNAGNSLNVDVPVESVKENIYTNDIYVEEDYSLDLKSLNNDITEDVDNISEDEVLKNQINDSDDINNSLNKDESDRVTSSSKKNNKIIIGSIIFIAMGSLGYYIINRKK